MYLMRQKFSKVEIDTSGPACYEIERPFTKTRIYIFRRGNTEWFETLGPAMLATISDKRVLWFSCDLRDHLLNQLVLSTLRLRQHDVNAAIGYMRIFLRKNSTWTKDSRFFRLQKLIASHFLHAI